VVVVVVAVLVLKALVTELEALVVQEEQDLIP
jgi:hypothetical protein